MTLLFVILIVLASVVLGLIVLVQNPKGGGLAGNIAGFSSQFMGVKQTTDVLEKGTWLFAGIIGALCLLSSIFISSSGSNLPDATKKATGTSVPVSTPANSPATPGNSIQLPTPTTTSPDTTK
jgi:preprotein translocase subunit SecG